MISHLLCALLVLMPALYGCNIFVPEELKENVLNSYRDDLDLLKDHHFPYPFLREKVRGANAVERKHIRPLIRAYNSFAVIESNNQGISIDRYTYDLGLYGEAHLEISYDSKNVLISIDEFGSSVIILE